MLALRRAILYEAGMTEQSIKALQGERNRLWAAARLKGLPVGTPERDRIAELDAVIRDRKAATAIPPKRSVKPSLSDVDK